MSGVGFKLAGKRQCPPSAHSHRFPWPGGANNKQCDGPVQAIALGEKLWTLFRPAYVEATRPAF